MLQLDDGHGRQSRMLLWNQPGTDVTAMVARCHKMVDTCQQVRPFVLNYRFTNVLASFLVGDAGSRLFLIRRFIDLMGPFLVGSGRNKKI